LKHCYCDLGAWLVHAGMFIFRKAMFFTQAFEYTRINLYQLHLNIFLTGWLNETRWHESLAIQIEIVVWVKVMTRQELFVCFVCLLKEVNI